MSRHYGNGSNLTRGEFVAHMQRVDETLKLICERLEAIENKIERPRRLLTSGLESISIRFVLIALGIAITYLAVHFGLDPNINIF